MQQKIVMPPKQPSTNTPGQGAAGPLQGAGGRRPPVLLPLEVRIAAQTVFERLQDFVTLRRRDALLAHGTLGGFSEILKDAPGIVFHIVEDVGHGVAPYLADELVGAVLADADGHDVGVPEQVVQVAEGFLIRAHKEHAEIIFIAVHKGMQIEGSAHTLRVDELVDAPVAVAGDIRNDRLAGREFRQAVHRHDREQLIDGPRVGE